MTKYERNVRHGREVDGPHSRFHSFMYWRDRKPRRDLFADYTHAYYRQVIFEMNIKEPA